MTREILTAIASDPNVDPTLRTILDPLAAKISEAMNSRGYSDISTVYAYYSPQEKARHGKHCEHWTDFGHPPATAPYRSGGERAFIAKIEAENPGVFSSYLISWSGCE